MLMCSEATIFRICSSVGRLTIVMESPRESAEGEAVGRERGSDAPGAVAGRGAIGEGAGRDGAGGGAVRGGGIAARVDAAGAARGGAPGPPAAGRDIRIDP